MDRTGSIGHFGRSEVANKALGTRIEAGEAKGVVF
jgi:hypothetical protein